LSSTWKGTISTGHIDGAGVVSLYWLKGNPL
jgi:hypothetical protein